jgi:phage shock protein PspC (stress-responsive transcriptional regulator)
VPPFAPPPWFGGATFSRDRLIRPSQGRHVGGVCAAIGRATNTDPVLWRVLAVVLGFFGGVGVLLYLIGWIAIPAEGDTASPIESLLGRGRSGMAPLSVVLLGLAVAVTFAFIVQDGFRATLLGGAVLLGVALLMKRNAGSGRSAPAPGPSGGAASAGGMSPPGPAAEESVGFATTDAAASAAAPGAWAAAGAPTSTAPVADLPAGEPLTAPLPPPAPPFGTGPLPPTAAGYPPPFTPPTAGYRPPFAPHGPYAGPPPYEAQAAQPPKAPKPPKPPRERSKLGRITFFAVLMVLGLLTLADLAGISVTVSAYFAAALATIGLGLVVGAWFGRARGLIALALVAAFGLGVSTGVERWGGHIANSDYRPQSIAQVADRYDFTVGRATLDLRAVDFTGAQQDTTVTMKVGQVRVLLPDDVDTTAAVDVDEGRAMVLGHEWDGNNTVQQVTDQGPDGPGGGTLRLTVQMQAGNVEVTR